MAASAPRRPLFNRPAWASSAQDQPENTDASTFGRQDVYEDILELEKKQRESREAKQRARAASKDKVKKEVALVKDTDGEPERKKRRMSRDIEDVSDSDTSDASSHNNSNNPKATKNEGSATPEKPVTRSTPQKTEKLVKGLDSSPASTSKRRRPTETKVIILEDDSDGAKGQSTTSEPQNKGSSHESPSEKKAKPPISDSESEEEDEYLRNLKQKARERARLQRLGIGIDKSASPASPLDIQSPPAETNFIGAMRSPLSPGESAETRNTPSAVEDPEVVLLIQSVMPNSKALKVNRRSSQSLQLVKEVWCKKQGFEPSLSSQVFLTWRGTRVFDSTTPRSLIRTLKIEAGEDPDAGTDPSQGKLLLEAMTQEIFDDRQKAKERKTAAEAIKHDDDDNHEDVGTNEPFLEEQPKQTGIVLKLVSKDIQPLLLRVRPNTSIDKIMRAFAQQRNIDKSKRCWLVWDGERLEPQTSAEDAGFENNDEVEVHPR